jgi:hypothetical protein
VDVADGEAMLLGVGGGFLRPLGCVHLENRRVHHRHLLHQFLCELLQELDLDGVGLRLGSGLRLGRGFRLGSGFLLGSGVRLGGWFRHRDAFHGRQKLGFGGGMHGRQTLGFGLNPGHYVWWWLVSLNLFRVIQTEE